MRADMGPVVCLINHCDPKSEYSATPESKRHTSAEQTDGPPHTRLSARDEARSLAKINVPLAHSLFAPGPSSNLSERGCIKARNIRFSLCARLCPFVLRGALYIICANIMAPKNCIHYLILYHELNSP